MIGTAAAIYEVRPGARFVLHNEGEPSESIEWLDSVLTEPTPVEIAAGLLSVQNKARTKELKSECSRLINENVPGLDQRNIIAVAARKSWELVDEVVDGIITLAAGNPLDTTALSSKRDTAKNLLITAMNIQDWIAAMQAECRASITEQREPVWPDWDDQWDALVTLV